MYILVLRMRLQIIQIHPPPSTTFQNCFDVSKIQSLDQRYQRTKRSTQTGLSLTSLIWKYIKYKLDPEEGLWSNYISHIFYFIADKSSGSTHSMNAAILYHKSKSFGIMKFLHRLNRCSEELCIKNFVILQH